MNKTRTPREVLAMVKDATDLVQQISQMKPIASLEFNDATKKLNEIIFQCQLIMKGEGPAGKANTEQQFSKSKEEI